MRRKDREITEIDEKLKVIEKCKVCRIAMQDTDQLYIVPMNFGYTYKDNQFELCFHSAPEGRKIDILKENKDVCFEMDYEYGLIEGEIACRYGYGFESIIGNGTVDFLESAKDKAETLQIIMKHQTGKDFIIKEEMTKGLIVFKVACNSFTVKRCSK